MDEKILTLPWQIQVALASGYAAYMASYVGIRDYHKEVDTIFRALAFGLIAVGILYLMPAERPIASIALAFFTTVFAGLWWRKFGRHWYSYLLRRFDFTWSDDTPSAWSRMQDDTDYAVSQISVLTDDDTWLFCTDASKYGCAPYGPCVLGSNGDIIMYVDRSEKGGIIQDLGADVLNDDWGALASYIPATKIKQVSIRRKLLTAPSVVAPVKAEEPEEPAAE